MSSEIEGETAREVEDAASKETTSVMIYNPDGKEMFEVGEDNGLHDPFQERDTEVYVLHRNPVTRKGVCPPPKLKQNQARYEPRYQRKLFLKMKTILNRAENWLKQHSWRRMWPRQKSMLRGAFRWLQYQLEPYFSREALLIATLFLSALLLLSFITLALLNQGVRLNADRIIVIEQKLLAKQSRPNGLDSAKAVYQSPNPTAKHAHANPITRQGKKLSRKVVIVVKGLVKNASVYLDRKRVRTPIVVDSAKKTAVVRARAKGYIDYEKHIVLDQSQIVKVDFYPKKKMRQILRR